MSEWKRIDGEPGHSTEALLQRAGDTKCFMDFKQPYQMGQHGLQLAIKTWEIYGK